MDEAWRLRAEDRYAESREVILGLLAGDRVLRRSFGRGVELTFAGVR